MSIATGQINIQNIDETLSVSLSSDSHVFPGAVSTALAGQVDVEVEAFLGAKQIDCSIDAVTPTPPKGLTITVVPTQSKTKIVRFAAATNLSQSGTYNIYVNAAGTTVKKTFSYAIAFKGNIGNTGPRGATGVGVSSITEYYLATAASSGVTSGAGAWSTTVQTITADKKYLWNYEKVNFDDGTSSPTLPVIIGVYGDKGDTGKTGNTGRSITKIEEFYLTTSASSGVVRTSGAWLPSPTPTTPTNKYLWNYERITWSSGTTPTYVEPFIIGIHGDEGKKGDPGKGISSTTVTYQAGSSGTVAPTGTWGTTIPTVAANQYLWTRTVITYTDSKTSTAYAVGKMGAQGPQGNTGPTGNGIDSTKVTYQASSSGTVTPTGTWQATVPSVADNQYLWTRVVISYTSGSPTTSYSVGKMGAQGPEGARGPQGIQGATGKQGPIGNTGTSVSSIVEWYLATNLSSGVTTSTDGWKTTMQPMTITNKYLWNYEVINFSDGSSSPTIPVIIGVYGNTGATGRALTGITEYYLASATASGVARPSTDGTGGWTTAMQPTSTSKPYLWNYEKLTWSVTPTTTYVEPIVIGVHGPQGPQGPQGPEGNRGPQGIQGPIGPDGKATYTWIKYADTPTTGMKDLPDGKKYMGIAHNKPTATESTAYGDYTWSLIQGPQGNQGVQGPIGPNGQPTYTWIKYADDENGSGMNDSPTGKRFLGLAHNKTTATEGTKASDYQWSPLYDNVQVGGRNLILNSAEMRKALGTNRATLVPPSRGLVEGTYTLSFDYKIITDNNSVPISQLLLYSNSSITNVNIEGGIAEGKAIATFDIVSAKANGGLYMYGGNGSAQGSLTDIVLKNVKLEKGNIATDWTPAPEDVEERLVSHDTLIEANKKAIALRATTAAVGSIDTRLKAAELKVTADAITSTVRSSTDYINDLGEKVSTDEVISTINQRPGSVTIDASKVNINGAVTFSSFDPALQDNLNKRARTFTSTPVPPYSLGDIWKNSTSTYMCKVARATGSYVAADWEKTGDVTSANKAADTSKVNGTAAATVVTGATAGSAAKTATDRWTYTGKTTINGGQIQADTIKAAQILAGEIKAEHLAAGAVIAGKIAAGAVTAGTIAAGAIDATVISAIKSNIGTLTAGKIQSKDGLSVWDLDNSTLTLKVNKLSIGSTNVATALSGKTDKGQSSVFNELMGTGGSTQGIYLSGGKVYLNGQYIKANSIGAGVITANAIDATVINAVRGKFGTVGGANLLYSSAIPASASSYWITSWKMEEEWQPNTEYTVTIKGTLEGTGTRQWGVWASGSATQIGTSGAFSSGETTFTFTTPSSFNFSVPKTLQLYNFPSTGAGASTVEWIKLEKGPISTGYSQHPSEFVAGIVDIDETGVTVKGGDVPTETSMTSAGFFIKDKTTKENLLALESEETQIMKLNVAEVRSESVLGKVGNNSLEFGTLHGYVSPSGTGTGLTSSDPADSVDTALRAVTKDSKYLDNMDVVIHVAAGSYSDWLRITGYVGAGEIKIIWGGSQYNPGIVRMTGNIDIYDCTCRVVLNSDSGRFVLTKGTHSNAITIKNCSAVFLERPVVVQTDGGNCVWVDSSNLVISSYDFTGIGTNRGDYGITADYNSRVYAMFGKGNVKTRAFRSQRGSTITAGYGRPKAVSGVESEADTGQFFSFSPTQADTSTTPPTQVWKTVTKTFEGALTRITSSTGWRTPKDFVQGRSPNNGNAYYGEAAFGKEIYDFLRNNGSFQNLSKIEIITRRGDWGYGNVSLKISSPAAHTLSSQARVSDKVTSIAPTSALGLKIRDNTTLTLLTSTTTTSDYANFSRVAIRITVQKKV